LMYASAKLDTTKNISINEIACENEWIKKHVEVFRILGFVQKGKSIENGVPVNVFIKHPKSKLVY